MKWKEWIIRKMRTTERASERKFMAAKNEVVSIFSVIYFIFDFYMCALCICNASRWVRYVFGVSAQHRRHNRRVLLHVMMAFNCVTRPSDIVSQMSDESRYSLTPHASPYRERVSIIFRIFNVCVCSCLYIYLTEINSRFPKSVSDKYGKKRTYEWIGQRERKKN